jgi:hypothetical protein
MFWYFEMKNPKMLINILGLYETNIDPTGSRIFANFKKKAVNDLMERGYYPNSLMGEISRADEDYKVLKEMFKLQ